MPVVRSHPVYTAKGVRLLRHPTVVGVLVMTAFFDVLLYSYIAARRITDTRSLQSPRFAQGASWGVWRDERVDMWTLCTSISPIPSGAMCSLSGPFAVPRHESKQALKVRALASIIMGRTIVGGRPTSSRLLPGLEQKPGSVQQSRLLLCSPQFPR